MNTEERILFGGNLRTAEYIGCWPFVDGDGKHERWRFDEPLPFKISPAMARILERENIRDTDELLARTAEQDVFRLLLLVAEGAPHEGPILPLVRLCSELNMTIAELVALLEESDRFHHSWAAGTTPDGGS